MSTSPTQLSSPQPADRVNLGVVQAAIWRNVDPEGRARYNATVEKRFKNGEGEWRSTDSFNRDELPIASKALDMAHTRILELQAEERKAAREAAS